jgi:hypothetical protein
VPFFYYFQENTPAEVALQRKCSVESLVLLQTFVQIKDAVEQARRCKLKNYSATLHQHGAKASMVGAK